MPELPPDIDDVIRQIDAADREADALTAGLSDAQFRWQPDGGTRWSVAQCLDHLAATNEVYGAAVASGIEAARRKGWMRGGSLQPGFFGRRFVQSLEPPVRQRGRAFASVRPRPALDRDDVLRRYHAAHERVRQLARDAATIDANRASFRNPFLKLLRVKVSTGLHVIGAHDRRHLWQARQVLQRPDFPSG
jgi:hypothetical protein